MPKDKNKEGDEPKKEKFITKQEFVNDLNIFSTIVITLAARTYRGQLTPEQLETEILKTIKEMEEKYFN